MARYIDVDLFIKRIKDIQNSDISLRYVVYLAGILAMLNSQPTADVVEVVHAEWFLLDECANVGVYCSNCHKKVYKENYANQKLKSNYCPNCGAKMDGQKKEEN